MRFCIRMFIVLTCIAGVFAGSSNLSAGITERPVPQPLHESGVTEELFPAGSWELAYQSGIVFGANNPNNYILAPQVISLRWRPGPVHGSGWLERSGAWTVSGVLTPVINGPESLYAGFALGRRYDFVGLGDRWVPYFDIRLGMGWIDSVEPQVPASQGQDFTFHVNVEAGVRYMFNERCSLGFGVMYWHMSNAGLSEPERENKGLDAFGPAISFSYRF